MRLIKIIIFLILVCSLNHLSAQNRVLLTNTPEGNSVKLKWVTPTVYTTEDIKVYRKQNRGSWTLLTPEPIGIKELINKPAAEKDDFDEYFESDLRKKDPQDFDGLMKLIVATRIVTDEAFADFLGVFYEDNTVESGKTYQYKIMLQKNGGEETLAVSENIKVRKHKPIDKVKDFEILTETESDTLLRFVWTPETGRYFGANIYRSIAGGPMEMINTKPIVPSGTEGDYSRQFFQDGDHIAGATYTFEVRPIDFFGVEGQASKKTITLPDTGKPIPVEVYQMYRVDEKTFRIMWAESLTPNVQGYEVHIGRTLEGAYKKVNRKLIPPGTGFYNHEVDASGSYFAKVITLSANGQTSASYTYAVEMNDLEPPAIPKGVTAEAESGFITINWKANKESDLLGYRIYRTIAKQPNKPAACITPEIIKGTSFKDRLDKRYKNEFFYTVVAVDTSLNLSDESIRVGAVMPDVIPPIPPFIKSIKANATSVSIQWLPGTDEDLAYYQLERSLLRGEAYQVIGERLSASTTDYIDDNLELGQKYYYRLRSFDQTGNASDFSEVYAAEPWQSAASAGAESFDLRYDQGNKNIVLSWKTNSDQGIVGAIILKAKAGENLLPASPMIKDNSYTDKAIEDNQRYAYALKIYYQDGGMIRSETKEITID